MQEETTGHLQTDFQATAAPPPERVSVTLDLDADVLEWLKAQPLGWQHEIRNTLRFFMETSNPPVPPPHEFDPFTYDPEAVFDPS
jgi:uncharacterized protein (DUF4415 family)